MFQQVINLTMGYGVAGELVYDGPYRVYPWQLISTPQPNIVGATAYTVSAGGGATDTSSGTAQAGGTGAFCGILSNPKVYANFTANGGLVPTMTLADDTVAELLVMGQMLCLLTTAANPGDLVLYNTVTGALASIAPTGNFVASITTTVMTVTGVPTGQPIGIGSVVTAAAGAIPGTIVTSLGTGTGGAGTYNVNNSQTVVSGAFASSGFVTAGYTAVPRAKVILRSSAANALAIVELTD